MTTRVTISLIIQLLTHIGIYSIYDVVVKDSFGLLLQNTLFRIITAFLIAYKPETPLITFIVKYSTVAPCLDLRFLLSVKQLSSINQTVGSPTLIDLALTHPTYRWIVLLPIYFGIPHESEKFPTRRSFGILFCI